MKHTIKTALTFVLTFAVLLACMIPMLTSSAAGTTRVYVYDNSGWKVVSAYVYGEPGQIFGAWNGKAMTAEENNWFYIDVPVDLASLDYGFNIKFNNTANANYQTGDLYVSKANPGNVYFSTSDVKDTLPRGSKGAVDGSGETPAAGETVINFYNNKNWTAVSAYVYYGETNVEPFGGWPGKACTNEGDGWWKVSVPLDSTANPFSIIFSDGVGGAAGVGQGYGAYVSTASNTYITIGDEDLNSDPTYASKNALLEALGVDTGTGNPDDPGHPNASTTRVWFYNSAGWSAKINAYVYGDCGEVFGGWPGKAATRDGNTAWWYADVPADVPFNIIFNDDANSTGNQTAGVLLTDRENVFVTIKADTSFNSKAAAEADAGAAKPIEGDPAGDIGADDPGHPDENTTRVWFYNSDGWSLDINAYAYNDGGSPLGSWPGKAATRDGNTAWWYVDVPLNADKTPFNIQFNDNVNTTGKKTAGVYISDREYVFTTMKADAKFNSKAAAEADAGKAKELPNSSVPPAGDNSPVGVMISLFAVMAMAAVFTYKKVTN